MRTSLKLLYFGLLFALANLGFSYQRRDEEITFCLKDNSAETIRTFWQETNDRCSKDPYKLLELYEKMEAQDKNECNSLLRSHVRKSLIDETAQVFENAINKHDFGFRTNIEIERLSAQIFKSDKSISQAIFERVIDAVYLHTEKSELAASLFDNTNFEQMVTSLLYLHWKYTTRNDVDTRLPVLLANYMRRIRQDASFKELPREVKVRVEKVVRTLPEMLSLIYFSTGGCRLINTAIWEYLYAPREIGDGDQKRTALTWIKEKNQTDSDGIISIQVRDNGDIAFSAYYNGMWSLLIEDVELHRPIFWLGLPTRAFNELKWWRVYWYEDYFLVANAITNQFMCATNEYDENRRYVTMHNDVDALSKVNGNPPCYWATRPHPEEKVERISRLYHSVI